jgi:Ca2+-binding EF-hand superfamily protein
MNKLILLAGTALLAIAGPALAQPAPSPRADRNADVTRQQVIERTDQRFARLDVNNDGRATPEEARQAMQQRREQAAGRRFERLDANRDGSISRAEFDQARSQLRERSGERRAERGGRRGMRGMHGPRRGAPRARGEAGQRMFGEHGFVTREQMRERALARFDRLDANRDGTLTAAERQQGRQQMRERMQERRGREG